MVSTLWKKGRRGSAPSVSGGGAQRGLGEEEIAGGLRGGRGLKDGPLVVLQRREPISDIGRMIRSEEHTSELQSLMRISYAVFCLKKKKKKQQYTSNTYYSIQNESQDYME